ncbi:MAG TPA: serine hydrolase domain-containing protein [Flavobacterium sp.]|nr:serine hydrolase domain-containing protein [Flavobacterium sp.]
MKLKVPFQSLLLFLLFLSLSGCSKQERSDDGTPEMNERTYLWMKPSRVKYPKLSAAYVNDKKASVERFCDKYFRNENNSISLLVAKNGQIIYERYQGVANKNKGTRITADTPMHIASVSKVFTATAVLLLVDKGKIQLDQKVNTILPEFPFPDISIKNLLSHRSGLRNYAYFVEEKGVWDLQQTLTNQDILNLFTDKEIKCDCPADTRFCYCNTNYAMLALVIEKITGMKYPEAMKTMIFEPLGMDHTYVFEYEKDRQTATPSYKGNMMEIGLDHLDAVYGDKNIYSTPRDMLKFDLARNAPTFLNKKLREEVYQGYSNEHRGEKNYGLGMRMIEWESGQKFYFHNGWWHGNTSSYITLKKDNTVIIALSNKFTRNTYAVRKLAPLFGDYPFKFSDED